MRKIVEYTATEIRNAAIGFAGSSKQQVRVAVMINNRTKALTADEQEKLVNRIWRAMVKYEPQQKEG